MKKILHIIIPLLLGLIFISSAITKLISIDDFHVFLYSLNILDLNYSMLLTQAIIGIELTIGLLFLSKTYLKPVCYFTIGLTTLFTFFIFYLQITNSNEDCHCFGTIIQLSNTATILKNIIIILMAIYLLFSADIKALKLKRLLLSSSLLLGFSIPMIVRPPDILFMQNYSKENYYYKPAVDKFINDKKLNDKKIIICFLSTGCKFCKLAAKRMSVISEKTNNTNNIFIALWNTDNDSEKFFKETATEKFESAEMDVVEFLKLTNGTIPLIVLYNNGIIENAFRYKDMNEYQIINFLETK